MSLDTILSRLDKVHKTGPNTYRSRCPGHDSKGLTLSIRGEDDGRVLLKCFAGCDFEAVLGAIGVGLDEAFPPKPIDHAAPIRKPFPAADVLAGLEEEALVVQIAAADLANGKPVNRARLALASDRIAMARELANG